MADLEGFELDHFLVEHTHEQAKKVAQAVNERQFDVVYFEVHETQVIQMYAEQRFNQILHDRDMHSSVTAFDRSVQFEWAVNLDQPHAEAVAIDEAQNDFIIPEEETPDTLFNFISAIAKNCNDREWIMADQIANDIESMRRTRDVGAIITGSYHTQVSTILENLGAVVRQIKVGNAALLCALDDVEDWDVFVDESHANLVTNAVVRALNNGQNPNEVRARYFEVLKRTDPHLF